MKTHIAYNAVIDQFFLTFCIVFAVVSFFFLLTILLSRIVKTRLNRRREILRDKLQRKLNVLVLSKGEGGSVFPWNFHLKSIRTLIRRSGDKQLMIDLIVSNKQNLLGQSGIILKKIYIRLGLKRFSLSKLSHHNSLVKIKGLQELAQMECADTLPIMKKMFYHSNIQVRQEAFTAMVRIGGSWPFSLITEYSEPIAGWMKVVIYRHLSTLPVHQLPKFYEWIISSNPSVKKFAMEMIRQFQQLEASTTLVSLLQGNDQDLAVMAAEVLSDLGFHQYADQVAELGKNNIHHESRTTSIIKSLSKVGNVNHKQLLAFHMIHGSYQVRLEAIRALLKLKISVLDQCIDFNIDHDTELEALNNHATDPLLQ